MARGKLLSGFKFRQRCSFYGDGTQCSQDYEMMEENGKSVLICNNHLSEWNSLQRMLHTESRLNMKPVYRNIKSFTLADIISEDIELSAQIELETEKRYNEFLQRLELIKKESLLYEEVGC